jgi:hypothetical protein
MSWESETSADNSTIIHYNTTTGETKIEDLENEEIWMTPIDSDGTDYIANNIVPGFAVGKWFILIGKKIKEALT